MRVAAWIRSCPRTDIIRQPVGNVSASAKVPHPSTPVIQSSRLHVQSATGQFQSENKKATLCSPAVLNLGSLLGGSNSAESCKTVEFASQGNGRGITVCSAHLAGIYRENLWTSLQSFFSSKFQEPNYMIYLCQAVYKCLREPRRYSGVLLAQWL